MQTCLLILPPSGSSLPSHRIYLHQISDGCDYAGDGKGIISLDLSFLDLHAVDDADKVVYNFGDLFDIFLEITVPWSLNIGQLVIKVVGDCSFVLVDHNLICFSLNILHDHDFSSESTGSGSSKINITINTLIVAGLASPTRAEVRSGEVVWSNGGSRDVLPVCWEGERPLACLHHIGMSVRTVVDLCQGQ